MKTEMSWVDNFSWFLTVTFDCRHLLWHFHCGEADVHIFGWIGLMLSIQLCPYLPVSSVLLGWAIVFGWSRTMTLAGVRSRYNCVWAPGSLYNTSVKVSSLGSMIRSKSKQRHFRHSCNQTLQISSERLPGISRLIQGDPKEFLSNFWSVQSKEFMKVLVLFQKINAFFKVSDRPRKAFQISKVPERLRNILKYFWQFWRKEFSNPLLSETQMSLGQTL